MWLSSIECLLRTADVNLLRLFKHLVLMPDTYDFEVHC